MATAKPASSTSEHSDNECSICHELFSVPKLLPCGHVLCRHCLVTWLQSQPQAHCPLCRCPVVEPRKAPAVSNTWDVVADGFPTDLAMEELVEAEQLLKKDHQCVACENVAATSLCLDCRDLMCATCKKVHKKFSQTKNHKVEDLSCLTTDQLTSNRPSPCPAHADKACELYCPSHDTSMCTVCFASRHRSCPEVTDLQQKADTSRTTLQKLTTKLTEAEKKLNQKITELDQHLQDKEKKSKASLAELKAACDRVKSAIDILYLREEQREGKDHSDVSKVVHDERVRLLQRRGRVTSERFAVERVQGMKKLDAITIMTTVMDERVRKCDLSANLLLSMWQRLEDDLHSDSVKRNRQMLTTVVACTVTKSTVTGDPQKPPSWCFHQSRGKKITLSEDCLTAEKHDRPTNFWSTEGVVFGDSPMVANYIYEIRVDNTDKLYPNDDLGSSAWMYTGVVTETPESIDVPSTCAYYMDRWREAVIYGYEGLVIHGVKQKTGFLKNMMNLPEGSRLGVLVDDKRDLHLYINGEDQGVTAPNMLDPCYPFFELYGPYKKITALPVTSVKNERYASLFNCSRETTSYRLGIFS